MKKLLIGLFMLGFLVMSHQVLASYSVASVLKLTSSDDGGTFKVLKGQTIKITLSNPGDGGYQFDTPQYDDSILQLVNHKHISPKSYPFITGDFGSDLWEFKALNTGKTNLEITATRPWDEGDTENMFSSTIIVKNMICPQLSTPSSNYCLNGTIKVITNSDGCSSYKCVNNTNTPVILGVSGPQSLNVNQTGTWTIKASNPNGGNLSYSVDWGDTVYYGTTQSFQQLSNSTRQSATFTHTYTQRGQYNPTFTVISDNNIRCIMYPCPSNKGSAKASLSVRVNSSNICPQYIQDPNYCKNGTVKVTTNSDGCPSYECISSNNGCFPGFRYSSTTGQICLVTVNDGCLPGYNYSPVTGARCY